MMQLSDGVAIAFQGQQGSAYIGLNNNGETDAFTGVAGA
jgi:hypothetical protein